MADVIIIGAGFYGCTIATHLSLKGLSVLVLEANEKPMMRASLINQARIHQGYHYPRDFTTAYRSSQSFPRFVKHYKDAVVDDFTKIYAVASRGSHVTARQFISMMSSIGAPLSGANRRHVALFSPNLVDGIFETKEFAFDASKLSDMVMEKALESGVSFQFNNSVSEIKEENGNILVKTQHETLKVKKVINCTYGRLHMLHLGGLKKKLKYEICEMNLINPPPLLKKIGITIMDGPFWSCMPYPSKGLHSLSHVRYTPGKSWVAQDEPLLDPYDEMISLVKGNSFEQMISDASRYVPIMKESTFSSSMTEVKSILMSNEEGDGRPILIEESANKNFISVLGGKLDNVFDILEKIDEGI